MSIELLPMGSIRSSRDIPTTPEAYAQWISTLKHGDRVIVQQFEPKGDTILSWSAEHWSYCEGWFHGNTVYFSNSDHPIRKDGLMCYWDSDTPWGNVFPARILPWHPYYAPKDDQRFRSFECPVFEPQWKGDRVYVAVDWQKGIGNVRAALRKALDGIPHYQNRANEAELYVCFTDDYRLKDRMPEGARFLYSEELRGV